MTRDTIRYFFRYNAWATELTLDAVAMMSPEEYVAPGCSGQGSVRDTLAHVLLVQQRWIATIAGTLDPQEATRLPFGAEDVASVAEARARWTGIAAETDAYLDSLTEEAVLSEIVLTHPTRGSLRALQWRLLLHVANHGTHHRAQILASVRRAGHAPAASDLLYFSMSPAGA
ncbi:MAG: DinB family protein [Gemmatimonadaceae bacterium]